VAGEVATWTWHPGGGSVRPGSVFGTSVCPGIQLQAAPLQRLTRGAAARLAASFLKQEVCSHVLDL